MTGPWTPLTEDEQLDSALRLANSGNHPTEPQLGLLKRALLSEHARANALQAERDEARRLLVRISDQVEKDLKGAHAEIVKLQGGDPAKYEWPEWTPQANTIRWLKKLANEDYMTDQAKAMPPEKEKRRPGKSKLVYDKNTRTIVTVREPNHLHRQAHREGLDLGAFRLGAQMMRRTARETEIPLQEGSQNWRISTLSENVLALLDFIDAVDGGKE